VAILTQQVSLVPAVPVAIAPSPAAAHVTLLVEVVLTQIVSPARRRRTVVFRIRQIYRSMIHPHGEEQDGSVLRHGQAFRRLLILNGAQQCFSHVS
jgi:hypothetical protein